MRRSVRRVHDRDPSSPWSDLERPPLSAARLRRGLVAAGPWHALDIVGRTTSTNADVSARARAGEPAGYVLIAEEQTAGRGRLDRSWQAPARSSLLVSVLLRPMSSPSTWTLLPFVAGVAVAEAVRGVGRLSAELKWPNDVLVDGRKLGGILVERVDSAVVVGIGVNVSLRSTELPVPTATSVALAGGVADREVLAKEMLRALARRYDLWQAAGGASSSILPAYREICATIGWNVTVQLPGGESVDGLVSAVDDAGRLVVMSDDGATSVSAGDVVHVRRAG
jgi:BirA family biotin operon repressor/biotin-[acetyl-CoA-carboxylase] ligase